MITKHSYSGEIFDKLFSVEPKTQKEAETKEQMVKVASGCINCPYAGKVSSITCNTCKFAAGISYDQGTSYIKCAYKKPSEMVKEAASIQGVHWDSGLPQKEAFDLVQEDIRTKVAEELKFAARNIGVKLAQTHLDEFTEIAFKSRLDGKKLERAARTFVTKIEETITPATKRSHTGTLNEVFSAVNNNQKTVISSMSSPTVGDNNNASCGYLGSKTNPNSIWNSNALTTAAQTPTSDEISKKLKEEQAENRSKVKESYWKALHEKLASKGLIPNTRVHSLSTEESHGFNTNLPANAMSIFGDHNEFDNIPEKTAGETLSEQNLERASKKATADKEVHIESAKTMESKNWLFR